MAIKPLSASHTGHPFVFDDGFLRKLERLELVARKIFRGLLRGEHTTQRRGRGLEFSDFRRYRPGDDFRHIDWNIYSRLDQLFLKLHASEEDITLHLIVDTSASMGFGEPSKFDQARRLAAAFSYIALHNFDRVGVSAFAEDPGAILPPIKARHHMASLLAFLAELSCTGATRFTPALRAFAMRTRNPGLVILISDLLGAEDTQDGIEALRHRGHDIVVIQLLAESEIDPPFDGALRMVDSETADEFDVTVDEALRRHYLDRLERYLQETEHFCRQRGLEYFRASTAIPFEDVVLKYLRQGTHLR
ncbi:MAG TPA: DUF58 domain-containing protein [Burkholderiales bacterium]|nr:DUF58 domain-containing protein [Burkholderiales bacterium]